MYPFERFTEDAKKVLTLAQEEAEGGHRPYIGTEHLLLGIIRGPDPARRRSLRWRSGSKRCGSPRSELAALVDKREYNQAAQLQEGERDLLKRLADPEQKWLDGLQPS